MHDVAEGRGLRERLMKDWGAVFKKLEVKVGDVTIVAEGKNTIWEPKMK